METLAASQILDLGRRIHPQVQGKVGATTRKERGGQKTLPCYQGGTRVRETETAAPRECMKTVHESVWSCMCECVCKHVLLYVLAVYSRTASIIIVSTSTVQFTCQTEMLREFVAEVFYHFCICFIWCGF